MNHPDVWAWSDNAFTTIPVWTKIGRIFSRSGPTIFWPPPEIRLAFQKGVMRWNWKCRSEVIAVLWNFWLREVNASLLQPCVIRSDAEYGCTHRCPRQELPEHLKEVGFKNRILLDELESPGWLRFVFPSKRPGILRWSSRKRWDRSLRICAFLCRRCGGRRKSSSRI